MAALPDISMLLPLAYGAHVRPSAAIARLDTVQEDGELVLCRVTQLQEQGSRQHILTDCQNLSRDSYFMTSFHEAFRRFAWRYTGLCNRFDSGSGRLAPALRLGISKPPKRQRRRQSQASTAHPKQQRIRSIDLETD